MAAVLVLVRETGATRPLATTEQPTPPEHHTGLLHRLFCCLSLSKTSLSYLCRPSRTARTRCPLPENLWTEDCVPTLGKKLADVRTVVGCNASERSHAAGLTYYYSSIPPHICSESPAALYLALPEPADAFDDREADLAARQIIPLLPNTVVLSSARGRLPTLATRFWPAHDFHAADQPTPPPDLESWTLRRMRRRRRRPPTPKTSYSSMNFTDLSD